MNPNATRRTAACLAVFGLAAFMINSALAQPVGQTNYQWSAGGDKATWSQTANWTQGLVPPTDGTTFQIDTFAKQRRQVFPERARAIGAERKQRREHHRAALARQPAGGLG